MTNKPKPLTEKDFEPQYAGLIGIDFIKEKIQSAKRGALQEIKDIEIFNTILEKRIVGIINKWFDIGD